MCYCIVIILVYTDMLCNTYDISGGRDILSSITANIAVNHCNRRMINKALFNYYWIRICDPNY